MGPRRPHRGTALQACTSRAGRGEARPPGMAGHPRGERGETRAAGQGPGGCSPVSVPTELMLLLPAPSPSRRLWPHPAPQHGLDNVSVAPGPDRWSTSPAPGLPQRQWGRLWSAGVSSDLPLSKLESQPLSCAGLAAAPAPRSFSLPFPAPFQSSDPGIRSAPTTPRHGPSCWAEPWAGHWLAAPGDASPGAGSRQARPRWMWQRSALPGQSRSLEQGSRVPGGAGPGKCKMPGVTGKVEQGLVG